MWSKRDGFPSAVVLRGARPALRARRRREDVDGRSRRRARAPAACASALRPGPACAPGTPVAVANVDFHASVPAATVTEPGTLVMIMGTSNGLLLLGDRLVDVEGMCGVVEDGVVPGLFGYEAGQSGLGDIFGWFARHVGRSHAELGEAAAALPPGRSGLLALDWWNGNRSVLVDADLSGLLVGMTLATTAPGDLPRAARGDRVRHARRHRRLRARRTRRRPDRRLRRAARAQPAAACRSSPT